MELLLLGHILGDFYFQNDELAEKKIDNLRYLMLHVILYILPVGVGLCMFDNSISSILIMLIFIMIVHCIIDWIKIKLDKMYRKKQPTIFVIDQIFHIITIILITCVLRINTEIRLDFLEVRDIGIIIAILVCWKPASIFTGMLIQTLQSQTVEKRESMYPDNINTGKLIGKLEREIILLLGISGQFGAVGLVLTAKSLARYKQLEEQSFAEKYLVGTLISTLIAVMCIILINN